MKRFLFIIIVLVACSNEQLPHTCQYKLCPYKGYTQFPGVIHTGEDTVSLDYNPEVYTQDLDHFLNLNTY